jgi:hypothetical protein
MPQPVGAVASAPVQGSAGPGTPPNTRANSVLSGESDDSTGISTEPATMT